ncbi:uncharacterized protein LOC111625835 [Centruroides sculpturatus]|uniref:uncharacterized protein LOC111625835 n=1 Tax=Centruroides sculpturatus TaxID=218467 RepID=UPI000C6D5018|nr:uncharacterized protein LOC111625835 [Centruroides sculpturatus]
MYKLFNVTPADEICDNPIQIEFLDFENSTYFICSTRDSLIIGKINEGIEKRHPLENLEDPRFACLEQNGNFLFYIVSRNICRSFSYNTKTREIENDEEYYVKENKYASAVAMWKTESGNYGSAVANYAGENSLSFKSVTNFFTWKRNYFDRDPYNVTSYDVSDLEVFRIHSSLFLAIANYRIAENRYRVDSEIYKFNIHTEKWESRQKIETTAAKDFEFFTFGEGDHREFFLAVASELVYVKGQKNYKTDSIIYKFVKRKFVPFQCIETVRARHLSSFKGLKGEFLLAIATMESISLYQYNGWKFVKTLSFQYSHGELNNGISHLSLHTLIYPDKLQPTLSLANIRGGGKTFSLWFRHENHIKRWYEENLKRCNEMKEIAYSKKVEYVLNKFKHVYLVDQDEPIILNKNVTLESEMAATTVVTQTIIERSTNKMITGLKKDIIDIKERLQRISHKLADLQDNLKKILLLNEKQTVTGHYKFKQLSLESRNGNVDKIQTTFMNGEDVRRLSSDIILTNDKQEVDRLEVDKIIVESDLHADKINNLSPNQLVTKNGEHLIASPKTFTSIETKDLIVGGKINGLTIDKDSVLLTEKHQVINQFVTFESITVEELLIHGLLNGINLNNLYSEIVLEEENYDIYGVKEIEVVEVEDISIEEYFNNENFDELWSHILWKDTDQDIYAPYKFEIMQINETVKAEKTVNGIMIPGPDVIFIDEDIVIESKQIFQSSCFIKELEVNSINGIQRSADGKQLNILLKSEEQRVKELRTFNKIKFESNRNVVIGTINGIDLVAFYEELSKFREMQINVILKDGSKLAYSTYFKLEKIATEALKLNTTRMPSIKFIFKQLTFVNNFTCNTINGLDCYRDFVFNEGHQLVHGKKTFEFIEFGQNVIVGGLLNDVNVSDFHYVLKTHGNQTFSVSKITFNNLNVENQLIVHNAINGIPVEEIVLLSEDSEITGNKIFELIEAETLHIDNMNSSSKFLNGLDIVNLLETSLTRSGHQFITGTKTFLEKLVIIEGGNLETDLFNGLDISEIWKDTLLIDEYNQTVTGKKTFIQKTIFESVKLVGSIDRTTHFDIGNWLLQGDQTINGSLIFLKDLYIVKENIDMKVEGFFNGINIQTFEQEIINVEETTSTSSYLHFLYVETEDCSVNTINGIEFKDLVDRNEEKVIISARKNFVKYFSTTDLYVSSFINGVDIEELYTTTVMTDDDRNFVTLRVEGKVFFKSDIRVEGNINSSYLVPNATTDPKMIYKYTSVYIENLFLEDNLYVRGSLCGMNIEELSKTYFSRTKDQTVTGVYIFEDNVSIENLTIESLLVEGLINEVNMTYINENGLRTSGNWTLTKSFTIEDLIIKGEVTLYGYLNEYDMMDFAIKSRNNHFDNLIIFENDVEVTNSFLITGTIQGINVTEWLESMLQYRTINTSRRIFTELSIDNIRIHGLLNNVNLSSVLLISPNQNISSTKIISNTRVNELEIYSINGIPFNYFLQLALNNTKMMIIDESVFEREMEVFDLVVHRTINDINVTDWTITDVSYHIETVEETIIDFCRIVHSPTLLLTYYEKVKDFYHHRTQLLLHATVKDDHLLVLLTSLRHSNHSTIITYWFKQGLFHKTNEIIPVCDGTDMETFTYKGKTFLVTTNTNASECFLPYKAAQIFIWKELQSLFFPFQQLPIYSAVDVEVFHIGRSVCLAFSESLPRGSHISSDSRVEIYCMNDLSHKFGFVQSLNASISHQVDVISFENLTYLAVAKWHNIDYDCRDDGVDLYLWHGERKFLLSQTLPSVYAKCVLFLPILSVKERHRLFLVVGENGSPYTDRIEPLTIYRYDRQLQTFSSYQKIALRTPVVALAALTLPSHDSLLFILVDSRTKNLLVYRYAEASAFVLQDSLHVEGAKSLSVFQDGLTHYLLLARRPIYNSKDKTGIVLKSTLKGKLPP